MHTNIHTSLTPQRHAPCTGSILDNHKIQHTLSSGVSGGREIGGFTGEVGTVFGVASLTVVAEPSPSSSFH